MSASTVPVLSEDSGLTRYLQDIRRYPMLSADEEYTYAKRWQDHGDTKAAHALVVSHLRLVAKIAMTYRGYGLPISEVISEGNIGLMQAVKKFEPERGFRLATYAMWWIRASIQDYILRSWSLVKLGTTSAQKKLFFGLRRAKQNIQALEEGDLRPEQVAAIASTMNVPEQDVIDMNRRLKGDRSLSAPVGVEGDDTWQDWIADEGATQEVALVEREEADIRQHALLSAMATLNERERDVFVKRRINDPAITLEELATTYSISRERVRQIETRAFEKVQQAAVAALKARELV